MTYKKTPPNLLSRKTAHTEDITALAEETNKKLQTDSENPAFEKLTNNPAIVTEQSDRLVDES